MGGWIDHRCQLGGWVGDVGVSSRVGDVGVSRWSRGFELI